MVQVSLSLTKEQKRKLASGKAVTLTIDPSQANGRSKLEVSQHQYDKLGRAMRGGRCCSIRVTGQGVRNFSGQGVRSFSGQGVRGFSGGQVIKPEVKRLVKQMLRDEVDAKELSKHVVKKLKQAKGGAVEQVKDILPGTESIPYLGQALGIVSKIQEVTDKVLPVDKEYQSKLDARLKMFGLGMSEEHVKRVAKEIGIPKPVIEGKGVYGGNFGEFMRSFYTGFRMGFTRPITTIKWIAKEIEHAIKNKGKGIAGGCQQCGSGIISGQEQIEEYGPLDPPECGQAKAVDQRRHEKVPELEAGSMKKKRHPEDVLVGLNGGGMAYY